MRSKTFLSYYPLKQGLKLLMKENYEKELAEFLSYYPLKQGLKLFKSGNITINQDIFILLSIKTRIETLFNMPETLM